MKRHYPLVALGLLQIAGDLAHVRSIKAIAAASLASPAPRVFSSVAGLETYSTRFELAWADRQGKGRRLEITPELNARLLGPYMRQRVYGSALAFGPVLEHDPATRPMLESVLAHALGGNAPLLRELGVDPSSVQGVVRVVYTPREGSDLGELPREIEAR